MLFWDFWDIWPILYLRSHNLHIHIFLYEVHIYMYICIQIAVETFACREASHALWQYLMKMKKHSAHRLHFHIVNMYTSTFICLCICFHYTCHLSQFFLKWKYLILQIYVTFMFNRSAARARMCLWPLRHLQISYRNITIFIFHSSPELVFRPSFFSCFIFKQVAVGQPEWIEV